VRTQYLAHFAISPSDSVGENIMFSGCSPRSFVRSFVHSSGRQMLPQHLMNGLSNLDETRR